MDWSQARAQKYGIQPESFFQGLWVQVDRGCLSCNLCDIEFGWSLCGAMARSSNLKTIVSLFGQYDFFPAQRQGISPKTRARLSAKVSHTSFGTFLCKRYHSNGLCLHNSPNLGKNDRKKLGLLIARFINYRPTYFSSNSSISGHPHSFIRTWFIQQIKHQYGSKDNTFKKNLHWLCNFKNASFSASLRNRRSSQYLAKKMPA